jgi:hypothetical protein
MTKELISHASRLGQQLRTHCGPVFNEAIVKEKLTPFQFQQKSNEAAAKLIFYTILKTLLNNYCMKPLGKFKEAMKSMLRAHDLPRQLKQATGWDKEKVILETLALISGNQVSERYKLEDLDQKTINLAANSAKFLGMRIEVDKSYKLRFEANPQHKATLDFYKNTYDLIKGQPVACQELAEGLAYLLLTNTGTQNLISKIELITAEVDLPGWKHRFVVIDRDPLSDLNDPSTWGEKCVIADAWYQLFCSSKDFSSACKEPDSEAKYPLFLGATFKLYSEISLPNKVKEQPSPPIGTAVNMFLASGGEGAPADSAPRNKST